MSGERAHAAAWKAAIAATWAPGASWPVLDYDEGERLKAKSLLPVQYVLITVTQRFGSPVYMSGGRARQGWRLTTLAVAPTTDSARWLREHVEQLRDKPLAALSSSALRFESENPIEPDGDRQSGITVWTYAAPV